MNEQPMFDPKELRKMQIEAIEYCLKQDLLAAKVTYKDRMRRILCKTRFVIRDSQNLADIMLGIVPIQFLEN